MLVNKLQELGDISSFRFLPQKKLAAALKDTPDHIAGIIADILLAFLLKSRIPANEAEDIAGKVREKKMGELFADMEPIDIPAEQAKIRKQKMEMESKFQEMQSKLQEMQSERQELENRRLNLDLEYRELQSERQKLESGRLNLDFERRELQSERQELERMRREIEAAMKPI